jgi:hypothetical protein
MVGVGVGLGEALGVGDGSGVSEAGGVEVAARGDDVGEGVCDAAWENGVRERVGSPCETVSMVEPPLQDTNKLIKTNKETRNEFLGI